MLEANFWQRIWALRDAVQENLDKIQEAYGLEKELTCTVATARNSKGELLATVEFTEGEKIDDRLRHKVVGSPQAIGKRILPILTSLQS